MGKSEYLNIRVTPEIKAALAQSADHHDESMSSRAVYMLRDALLMEGFLKPPASPPRGEQKR